MDDVERDSSVTINIGFGNITFHKSAGGGYARAVVDVSMGPHGHAPGMRDEIEIAFTVPASPETDTISEIVERSRRRITAMLLVAADHFEAETAESLLYPEAS